MHELGITQEIVESVVRRAEGRKVHRVRIRVGRLAGVVPSALLLCFDLCAEEAGIAGARLVIDEVPGCARCRACGAETPLDVPYGDCAGCGGVDLEWLRGHELAIVDMEVS
jgi:hydrogenase nickel incorporation protein HypA/HybF